MLLHDNAIKPRSPGRLQRDTHFPLHTRRNVRNLHPWHPATHIISRLHRESPLAPRHEYQQITAASPPHFCRKAARRVSRVCAQPKFRKIRKAIPVLVRYAVVSVRWIQPIRALPIVVHPVGIKYWLLTDPAPEIKKRLARMERRLGWHPQDDLPLLPRVEKLGGALVSLKEIEPIRIGNTYLLFCRGAAKPQDHFVFCPEGHPSDRQSKFCGACGAPVP